MFRTLLMVPALIATLALSQALADPQVEQDKAIDLDEIFSQMDLTLRMRNDVRDVIEQFQEDRRAADEALQELSETLPPQEEVSATTVYSDIVLESRLNRILTSFQVEQIMSHIEAQRRQQSNQQDMDNE